MDAKEISKFISEIDKKVESDKNYANRLISNSEIYTSKGNLKSRFK